MVNLLLRRILYSNSGEDASLLVNSTRAHSWQRRLHRRKQNACVKTTTVEESRLIWFHRVYAELFDHRTREYMLYNITLLLKVCNRMLYLKAKNITDITANIDFSHPSCLCGHSQLWQLLVNKHVWYLPRVFWVRCHVKLKIIYCALRL
jgi:hypothetical protein